MAKNRIGKIMILEKTEYYCDPILLKTEAEKYIGYFNNIDQLSLKYDPEKKLSDEPHYQCIGRSPNNILEWNFTTISPIFENSLFINLIDKLKYKTKRIRLMRMKPRSCYSLHYDYHKRLHWALITFPECHMSFRDEKDLGMFSGFHIPADGYAYLTDTLKYHTAINPTLNYRYHLVIDIIE